jgi:hypothetical protein
MARWQLSASAVTIVPFSRSIVDFREELTRDFR